MGLQIKVSNADYSSLMDIDALKYITAAGITDDTIILAVNFFTKNLKAAGIWDKIDHIYAALGATYNQVKYDLKNVGNAIIPPFTNTLNKGFVCTGAGNVGGGNVNLPLDNIYIGNMIASGGHALYFLNQTLSAPSTLVANLGLPLSNSLTGTPQSLFCLSGSGSSPVKKTVALANVTASLTPVYTAAGSFAMVKNGTGCSFYGNGAVLGTATFSGSVNTYIGNITINDGKYPVNNTVPYVSFGTTPLSDDEIAAYVTQINTLINAVHGIII